MEQQPAQNLDNGYVVVTLKNDTPKNLFIKSGDKGYPLDSGATVTLPRVYFSEARRLAKVIMFSGTLAKIMERLEVKQAEPQAKKMFELKDCASLTYQRLRYPNPDPQGKYGGLFRVTLINPDG